VSKHAAARQRRLAVEAITGAASPHKKRIGPEWADAEANYAFMRADTTRASNTREIAAWSQRAWAMLLLAAYLRDEDDP
jgi:hypothetical protein